MRTPLTRALKITTLLTVTLLLLVHRAHEIHAQSPALNWDGFIEHVTAPYVITFAAGFLTVTPASSIVAASSSANPSGFNQAVTLRLGTVALTNGSASLTTNGFSAASHTISAIYSGDLNVAGSAQSFTQVVLASAQSSSTTISSSANPATTGASVTLTATVTAPSGLSGDIAFYDGATLIGTATLSGTKAKLVIATLSNGAHAIMARYLGNATIPPGISPVLAQTIKPSGTTLRNSNASVAASPSPSALDQTVAFAATVSGNQSTPPTGVVIFFVDGFVVSGPVALSPGGNASAQAVFTTNALAHGVHTVTVAYLGDGTYKGAPERRRSQSTSPSHKGPGARPVLPRSGTTFANRDPSGAEPRLAACRFQQPLRI